ncbi:LysM peptidoglycan-binding domain-containing protein [Bacillus norwichensis]|uniref:LysM peptidoglycan-binding domain-containing protein n=1 Tax=Bacillus norwichensis TaxID=2762217 RepID=A0ABR8VHY1_9BACI|nr:LysM peptidoglycan-binding domain-containing protein [Bacillus norwichensis]MBD8004375.1 LysM peptidoglycan-binding domain-containing protein [Bacillus norwichensis]
MIIHVVRSGETLAEIARRYGSNVSQIAASNELPDPNRLIIGQALVIPIAAQQHIVRSGETLWQIAQRYGVSLDAIIRLNQLANPNMLELGTALVIPARVHTVQAGETLWQIAQRYGTTVQEIVRLNQIQNPNVIPIGTVLTIPFPKPVIDVNAYTISRGETGAKEVREVGRHLTYITPFAYIMKEDGSLESIDDGPIIKAAQETHVVPMMSITNFSSTNPGTSLAHTILSNPELQERLLTNAINIMDEKDYRILNIDFENVRQTDREAYNQFLQRAADRLHPLGYFLSTALAPKTSSEQQGLLYEAHEYEAHGRIADFVVLMTYEWGYRLGPPQAISPLNQMRRVLDYAVTVIPRNKILMGFQLYARDWIIPHVQGQEAETFDMQEALRRALKYGATIQYDERAQSPFFRYTDEQGRRHEVWFEDARSAQAKFDLVKEFGLRGVSYWVLGYPFPQNWLLLEDNFIVRKM